MIVNVSRKQIEQALKFAGDSDTRYTLNGLSFHVSGKNTVIRATDGHRMMLDISNQEGSYPGCNAVVEPVLAEGVKIHIQDKYLFIQKIEDVLTMGKLVTKRARTFKTIIKFRFTKTRITMVGPDNSIVRSITCDVPAVLVGKKAGFNAAYLHEALAHVISIASDGIELFVKAGEDDVFPSDKSLIGPMAIKPYGKDFPLHVVMPMRIN